MLLQYDGTDFAGSQIQPEQRTVQGVLQSGLSELFKTRIKTVFAGRTDAGVHAREQTVKFLVTQNTIPFEKIAPALNTLMPSDIVVLSSEKVDSDFHSRFSAKKRTYRYFINNKPDVFRKKYTLFHPFKINIDKMNSISDMFLGNRDFRSFCSYRSDTKNYFCNVSELMFFEDNDESVMQISSDRFLHNMVRIILSVFLEYNCDNIGKEDILYILEKKDRRYSPKTISPGGLFLWRTEY
ncbi:MAG: tRNA pseudouridine(38-40) synthase TruA [Candidatus Delongbacteria bacterium]